MSDKITNEVKKHADGIYCKALTNERTGYFDITFANKSPYQTGFLVTSAGLFPFRTNSSGEPEAGAGSELTIENRGNNVYRFTCTVAWYTRNAIITTWKWWE